MTTPEKYIVFGQPDIQQPEIDEVIDSLKKGWLGTGPKVAKFEEQFAEYQQAPHAAAVNSCTAALHLSLIAAGLKSGDEVIAPAMTFCATINAIIHSGATPVLVDVDPFNFTTAPDKIEEKITPQTKAIVIVHFAGYPCDMTAILAICKKYNLKLIEDCAHAIETRINGKAAGTFGDFGCFSFYATKNITTGEGGMIISSNKEAIHRIKTLALHGLNADAWHRFSDNGYIHYLVNECGFKYNMMDLQAAIGIHQLERIEESLQKRERIWETYIDALKGQSLQLPSQPPNNTRHGRHLFTMLINEDNHISRDEFIVRMHNLRIGTGVHYLSLATHPFYQDHLNISPNDFPIANAIGQKTVSLPLNPSLSDSEINRIIDSVIVALT